MPPSPTPPVTRSFGYAPETLQLTSEALPHFDNEVFSYTYEDGTNGTIQGRSSGYTIGTTADPAASYAAAWVYDNAGRVDQITGPGLNGGYVAYGYLINAPGQIASRIVFDASNNAVAETVHTFEPGRNQITAISNTTGSTTVSNYTYAYDEVSQRTHMGTQGAAFAQASHFAYMSTKSPARF